MASVDDLQNAQEAMQQREEAQMQAELKTWQAILDRDEASETSQRVHIRLDIPLEALVSEGNLRPDLPNIEQLAVSIKEKGLLMPLLVRRGMDDDPYILIAGARRLAALRLFHAPEDTVPCEIIEDITEAEAYEMMLIENEQRENFAPLAKARALRSIMQKNEHATAAELARSLGLSPQWVQKHLRLLDLSPELQAKISQGDLSFTIQDLIRKRIESGDLEEEKADEMVEELLDGNLSPGEATATLTPHPTAPNIIPEEDEFETDDENRAASAQAPSLGADAALEAAADRLLANVSMGPVGDDETERATPHHVERYVLQLFLNQCVPAHLLEQYEIPAKEMETYINTLPASECFILMCQLGAELLMEADA